MHDSSPTHADVSIPTHLNASACMFWLTTTFGIAVFSLALFGGYEYVQVAPPTDAGLYPYIMIVIALTGAAGLGLLYSSRCWRANRVRNGLLSILASIIALFGGPWLVLVLLMG